jgi:twitching motility protein PilT
MDQILKDLLTKSLQWSASDVHIVAGLCPLMRIHTELEPVKGTVPVTPEQIETYARSLLSDERYEQLRQKRDLDFSAQLEGMGRFRVNAHYQRETLALSFRAIPRDVPVLEDLNLPAVVNGFPNLPRGMVLVTGVTGSGKSTTLAAMIEKMNRECANHVITIEDPVEYELVSKKCVIEQRELGCDVPSFASGLRHALRQDPDIILVGEMRDLETTSAAITAAETGHLVLSTLHTQNASQTIERIIDIYPAAQQNQIRAMLGNTLQAVVSQVLFKRADAPGMVPACEIMICTPAIRHCIRENRIHELPNIIQTNAGLGMCTLDDSIKTLYLNGLITQAQAIEQSSRPESLSRLLSA